MNDMSIIATTDYSLCYNIYAVRGTAITVIKNHHLLLSEGPNPPPMGH
jgi:hypothetical protein